MILHCATSSERRPAMLYSDRISRPPLCSHASCVSSGGIMKVRILWHVYCYMVQSVVVVVVIGEKQKAFNVLYVQYAVLALHRTCIKQVNSRVKLSLKTEKPARIKPVWLKIMVFGEEHRRWKRRRRGGARVQNEGGYLVFLLHYREEHREWSVCISLMSMLFFLLWQH